MADDIVRRLVPYVHDEQRMPAGLIRDVMNDIERLEFERDEHRDAARVYKAEVERLRAVTDALVARPFRGTSAQRRDRMYGSDWEAVHDALDALEVRRRD